jgi:hypothetical protein
MDGERERKREIGELGEGMREKQSIRWKVNRDSVKVNQCPYNPIYA